jgi:predicted porin
MNNRQIAPGTLVIALTGLASIAQPASAQSSVTLFGIADLAARSVHNEGTAAMRSLASGGNSTSRIGFRGVEDLGDGLTAGFYLEAGMLLDTGSSVVANQFFDRRATLSIASRALGEVRAGRDYIPSYVSWTRFDPFSYVGVAGSNNMVSATPVGPIRSAFGTAANTTVRSSNSIQYLLPGSLAGVEGGLMVAAGEGAIAGSGTHKVLGARLGYVSGPIVVSGGFTQTENSLTVSDKFKDAVLGASYDFGLVKVSGAWRRFSLGSPRQTNMMVAAVAPIGLGDLKLSYVKADFDGRVGTTNISTADATQLGLGYVYNLSKRTALYATASRISNKGVATFSVPGGSTGMKPGGTSSGYEAGVRHNF